MFHNCKQPEPSLSCLQRFKMTFLKFTFSLFFKGENILCPNLVGIDLSYFAMFESVLQNSFIMSYNILRYYFVLIGKGNNLGQVITASYLLGHHSSTLNFIGHIYTWWCSNHDNFKNVLTFFVHSITLVGKCPKTC